MHHFGRRSAMRVLRVLVAGRNGTGVEAIRTLFTGARLDVTTATDGVDCMTKLRDLEPDLLILEPPLLWGGCDGVLARMQEEADLPLVPVLLLPAPGKGPAARSRLIFDTIKSPFKDIPGTTIFPGESNG
jgi:PleD family two-component response regulator